MRRGFTLVEVLLSLAIMGMVVVAVGVLTQTAYQANEHTQAVGTATQHARVAIQRITRMANSAYAVDAEPGIAVIEHVGGETVPTTLVVWSPPGDPQNADGPPLVGELVFFTPNPNDPTELWELNEPGDSRTQSLTTINSSSGRTLLAGLKASSTATKRVVMRRMQTVTISANVIPLLRFSTQLRPSESEWAQLEVGGLDWEDASWPQSMFTDDWGLRSTFVQIEAWMSIAPASNPTAGAEEHSLPFFGATTMFYRVTPPS